MSGPKDKKLRKPQRLRDILDRASEGEREAPVMADQRSRQAQPTGGSAAGGVGGASSKSPTPAGSGASGQRFLILGGATVALVVGAAVLVQKRHALGLLDGFPARAVQMAAPAREEPEPAPPAAGRDGATPGNANPVGGWSEMANRLAPTPATPRLEVANVQVAADSGAIDLPIRLDTAGAPLGSVQILIAGLPAAVRPSAGTQRQDGLWSIRGSELDGVKLANPEQPGRLQLTVTLAGLDGAALASQGVVIDVLPAETKSPFGKNASEDNAKDLFEQGKARLADGDVIAARMFFKKAASGGDAQAALALGATYDPGLFKSLQVQGMRPDVEMARQWYQRAADLGSKDALDRLDRLSQR